MRGSLYRFCAPPSPLCQRPGRATYVLATCAIPLSSELAAINRTYIIQPIKYTIAHEERASAGENATRRDTFLLSLHRPLRTFPR